MMMRLNFSFDEYYYQQNIESNTIKLNKTLFSSIFARNFYPKRSGFC